MPRKARINSPGVLLHVMARGLDGRNLFEDDDGHIVFLDLFKKRVQEVGYKFYALVLMDNHYHLILETEFANLSRAMHYLNTSYMNKF